MQTAFQHTEPRTSLGKGLVLVDVLAAESGPLALGELAGRAAQPRSTTHRLLRTLVEFGLVSQHADGRYALGLRLLELGRRAVAGTDLRTAAAPVLRELRDRTGETAHLGILDRDEVVYLDKVESRHAVRMTSEIGGRNPVHCTALGKAILAHRAPDVAAAAATRRLARRTDRTLTSRAALAADLEQGRDRGFFVDDEENEPGLRCLGAAVFDATGQPVAAVSVSGPTTRITGPSVRTHGELVAAAARAISRTLGHRATRSAA